jgi:predicted amidophosphoribosyltransferase
MSYRGRTVPGVLDALLPLTCPGCGHRGSPLCAKCRAALCPAPRASPPPGIDAWSSPFEYRGAARELVARLKYRNARAAVPWLAEAMVHAVLDAGLHAVLEAPDVTWAPTTRQRRRARGFDPAEILARAVARRLGACCTRLLDRQPGPPQTGLPAAARLLGPRFVARRAAPSRVLLVDDVATTGATLAAAAVALRSAGAQSVLAVTAARTPPPSSS